jgi:sugar-phosphatase
MPAMRHAACIFDLDGTLIDSEVLWVAAGVAVLQGEGCAVTHAEAQALIYGRSWRDIHPEIVRRYPALRMDEPTMTARMREHYVRLRGSTDIVIASSVRLLRRLAAHRPVCVVSGSARADVRAGLELAGVERHIAFFLAAEDYSPGKPDPACFRLAAQRLGVRPEQCLVFEDSSAGVAAAKAAGMTCVALVRDGRPRQDVAGADRIVADLSELDETAL